MQHSSKDICRFQIWFHFLSQSLSKSITRYSSLAQKGSVVSSLLYADFYIFLAKFTPKLRSQGTCALHVNLSGNGKTNIRRIEQLLTLCWSHFFPPRHSTGVCSRAPDYANLLIYRTWRSLASFLFLFCGNERREMPGAASWCWSADNSVVIRRFLTCRIKRR